MSAHPIGTPISRRRFLQASGALAGSAGVASWGGLFNFVTLDKVHAQPLAGVSGETVVTKNFCHQCPARCGIDVYTTNGRVHGIFGTLDNPLSNGKLCPKGHYGQYLLYDVDRFKGPMKRTNAKKGRNEDPGFVPISWDEALGIAAGRLNTLRDKGESHRFAICTGRGWGATDVGILKDFGALYGTPNSNIGHSAMCSDASKKAKLCIDGNYSYNAYDYANSNYLLIFGASFLEAFRPFNYNMQVWGHMRTKSPKTKVTVVDVHLSTTGSAADRLLLTKPGTDGALALALAHVILTEGLWDRAFVGDFVEPGVKFETGKTIDPAAFQEKWTLGLIDWWNAEVKDRTPEWAEQITTIPAGDIRKTALEFGRTRPAIALFERGATAHTNGVYNGMAIHALNALVGSLFAEGGLFYQMKTPWAKPDLKGEDYMDAYTNAPERKQPRIDKVKTDAWPMASNMLQELAINHMKGDPYKLDTVMFYLTGPIFSAPESRTWEKALQDIFVIDTSPYPGETAMFADLVLPDHTYLERLQIADTYPFQGWPMAMIRTPAVQPLFDTKVFGDAIIDIGKRINGSTGEYYQAMGNTENLIKAMAKGFENNPGDNGVNSYESFVEKGCWYKKPYAWRQIRGEFYAWDDTTNSYSALMTPEQVKEKLLKTPSGRVELNSGYLNDEHHAHYVHEKLGIPAERAGFPQWIEPRHSGGGDLHFISPKLAGQAEGRSANLPHASAMMQPTQGGKRDVFLEIHPQTAAQRGIRDGDRVRLHNKVGAIEVIARLYAGVRPDTVVLPMIHGHWAQGRWATSNDRLPTGSTNEITELVCEPISGLACYHSGMVNVEKV